MRPSIPRLSHAAAIAALKLSEKSLQTSWKSARDDYRKLINAKLGQEGTNGQPIPATLFDE